MVDTCVIRFDPEGAGDDVLDPETLAMVRPDPDANVLYEGPCRVRFRPAEGSENEPGGVPTRYRRGAVAIPLSAPAIPTGAVVTITEAEHDPELVDRDYVVVDSLDKSLAIQRILNVQRPTEVPR